MHREAIPARASTLWYPSTEEGTTTEVSHIGHWIDKCAEHPLAVLPKLNGGELYVRAGVGAVGFFRWKDGLLVVGGALSCDDDKLPILAAFLDWCQRQGKAPYFVHFSPETATALATLGFNIDQLGASYSLRFENDDLSGKGYQQVRRKLNKARRSGVVIERVDDEARYAELVPQLRDINRQWLRQKDAKAIRLLVCEFERIKPDPDTLIYTAWHEGKLVAYLVLSRTPGRDWGWFHNLSRRETGCVDGTMQLIVSTFMREVFSGVIHFGFTPLVELTASAYPHSRAATWIASWLAKFGGIVYPARSQRQYKASWNPTQISPEYFAYRGNTLRAVFWFLRATNSL
jgi:lysylphosphatidylglycerol synthetase-like protein (DUF2156 family)